MKKIGILTSGGDAPGMNNVIINLIHYAFDNNYQVTLIQDGYKGLINNDFVNVNFKNEYDSYLNEAGSFIYCARNETFIQNWEIGISNLENNNVECLIIIGGNGSYEGAKLLSTKTKTIFIPATIDNDVNFTDYCIGFDSCLNEIVLQSNKIIKTFQTHKNIVIVETMGRYCSDLVNAASKLVIPNINISHENKKSVDQLIKELKPFYEKYNYGFILMSEHLYSKNEIDLILKSIESTFKCAARFNSLGYSQRGANVTEKEKMMALNFAKLAIKNINNEEYQHAIFFKDNNFITKEYKKI